MGDNQMILSRTTSLVEYELQVPVSAFQYDFVAEPFPQSLRSVKIHHAYDPHILTVWLSGVPQIESLDLSVNVVLKELEAFVELFGVFGPSLRVLKIIPHRFGGNAAAWDAALLRIIRFCPSLRRLSTKGNSKSELSDALPSTIEFFDLSILPNSTR